MHHAIRGLARRAQPDLMVWRSECLRGSGFHPCGGAHCAITLDTGAGGLSPRRDSIRLVRSGGRRALPRILPAILDPKRWAGAEMWTNKPRL